MKISYPPSATSVIPISALDDIQDIQSGNITAGNSENYELNPASGILLQLLSVGFQMARPPSSTSGAHIFQVYRDSNFVPIYLEANFDQAISIANSEIVGAYITQRPNDNKTLQAMCRSLFATNGNPIVLRYTNNTDVTQTVGRTYRFQYIEYDI